MNPIARYRAAAARLRALEANATKSWTPSPQHLYMDGGYIPMKTSNARLICASRNLLLPLLAVGDELVAEYEWLERINCIEAISGVRAHHRMTRIIAALTAITEAIEREIGNEFLIQKGGGR